MLWWLLPAPPRSRQQEWCHLKREQSIANWITREAALYAYAWWDMWLKIMHLKMWLHAVLRLLAQFSYIPTNYRHGQGQSSGVCQIRGQVSSLGNIALGGNSVLMQARWSRNLRQWRLLTSLSSLGECISSGENERPNKPVNSLHVSGNSFKQTKERVEGSVHNQFF